MSLQLDARQRAMLQEMGITIWQPAEKAPARTPVSKSALSHESSAPRHSATNTAVLNPPVAAPLQAPVAAPAPAPVVARAAPAHPAPAPSTSANAAAAGNGSQLRAPQLLYPNVDASQTPAGLGSSWLVILETATPDEPFGGDSGKLLDNMLRAMQLHRHPRTYACVLARNNPADGGGGGGAQGEARAETTLTQAIAELRPDMVLILGLGAARAILDSREPLGRLRAVPHQLADGTPAVVSYDPAYLLRAPDAKGSAWADLCRALAVVRKSAAT